MKEVIINNGFNKNRRSRSPRKEQSVDARLASLRQSALVLVQEVRKLGDLFFLDVSQGIDLQEELRNFEIKLIRQALSEAGGSQVRAARLLGLKASTLNEKIKRYGIDPLEKQEES